MGLGMLVCFLLAMRQHIVVYSAAGCVRSPTAVTVATRYSRTSLQHLLALFEPFPEVSEGYYPGDISI